MRIVVSSESASEREYLRQVALSLGLECSTEDCVVAKALTNRLKGGNAESALLALGLDTTGSMHAIHACIGASVPIYVVADELATVGLPDLLRAGACGYLRKGALRSDLFAAIRQLRSEVPLRVAKGKVFALTGGLPGVGVTTVATNLAFALAEKHPHQVALAQLTDGVADLALNLALTPAYPLSDIAAGWHRMDGNVMGKCLLDHPAGVSVLAEQPGQSDSISWEPSAMLQVLGLLRSRFEFVVVDLGHSLDEARQKVLKSADAVGIVQRLDVPALRVGRNWLDRLREIGVPAERLLSIANRYGQREQVSWSVAHDALDGGIGQAIPDDPASVNLALNTGRPLAATARTAVISQCFAKLANHWDSSASIPQSRRSLAEAS